MERKKAVVFSFGQKRSHTAAMEKEAFPECGKAGNLSELKKREGGMQK